MLLPKHIDALKWWVENEDRRKLFNGDSVNKLIKEAIELQEPLVD